MERCRICGKALCGEVLWHFIGQPAAAQELPDFLHRDEGVDFSVRRCASCGVIQLDCPAVPYFREVIRTAGLSREMREFRLKNFSDFIRRNSLQGKKVLECGCGGGEYLSLLKECSSLPKGIDGGEKNVKNCLAKGLDAEKLYFETGEEKVAGGPFDGFCMLNVLEHIPHVPSYLAGIRNNLKEEGVGLVEVPDFDRMLKENFFAEFIPDHLYYFTAETLRNTLEENGFAVLQEENVFHSYILSMQVKKKRAGEKIPASRPEKTYENFSLEGMKEAEKAFTEELGKILSSSSSCAVWGASHQTLSVLAFLRARFGEAFLASKIPFVADSAPFKQGKITPATHIPIVPPERLRQEKVGALLIMGGGYSDEIFRIAREEIHFPGKIYILRSSGLEQAQ